MSLSDKILEAQSRQQPYINLTNQKYQLSEIFSEENIGLYQKIKLKSLYARLDKLELNEKFGEQLNSLTRAGFREVFVFCNQEDSNLTQEDFQGFLEAYKIRINLRIAPVSADNVEQINIDTIGQKDFLGFDKIENYQLIYRNGCKVDLLNSNKSDQIISNNHQEYKAKIAGNYEFGVKEPQYIISSSDSNLRESKSSVIQPDLSVESQLQLEISNDIDVDLSLNQEISQENELDIDQDQLANKFKEREAYTYALKKIRGQFTEPNLLGVLSDNNQSNVIYSIFNSDATIEYITQKALDLIIPHISLFGSGININNLPIGLGFKDGIIFASEQRLDSMPINEFTVNLDYISTSISDPLKYSWLYFASKGSISLNDLYGSEDCPKIFGQDQHPGIDNILGDSRLDIPYNHRFIKYTVDPVRHTPSYTYKNIAIVQSICVDNVCEYETMSYDTSHINFYISTKGEELDEGNIFPHLLFYNLSLADRKTLRDIWHKLEERGLGKIFTNILLTNKINDGGCLLEEQARIFLDKLFYEILPIPGDNHKQEFFKEILSIFNKWDPYRTQNMGQTSIEDVFEGLNASYQKFQEFLVVEDIKSEEQRLELTNKLQILLAKQLASAESYKVTTKRIFSILELNSKNGGSLSEQIEYLSSDGNAVAKDPKAVAKGEQFNQNVIHSSIETYSINARSEDVNIKALSKTDQSSDPAGVFYLAMRYLATIAPHQRASIDTYAEYFKSISAFSAITLKEGCEPFSHYLKVAELKTSEYVEHTLPDHRQYNIPIFSVFDRTKKVKLNKLEYRIAKSFFNDLNKKLLATHGNCVVIITDQSGFDLYTLSWRYLQKIEKTAYSLSSEIESKIMEWHSHNSIFNGIIGGLVHDIRSIYRWYNNQHEISLHIRDIMDISSPWPYHIADIEGLFKDLEAQASEDANKLTNLLGNAKKHAFIGQCYAPIGVTTANGDLVNSFTTSQAIENLRMLTLNIISSSGPYYDKQYPDQEFSSYSALLSILFAEVKFHTPIKAKSASLEVEEDFNKKTALLKKKITLEPKSAEVKYNEELHQKMVAKFLRIFEQNQEFKFGEVIALGLIANFNEQIADEAIKQAKELHKYNGYLYQIFRVLLASSSGLGLTGLDELKARVGNITNNLRLLTEEIEIADGSTKVHEFLTNHGKSPENLVFFASCFRHHQEINVEQLKEFLNKIAQLSPEIKGQLLDSIALVQLPFINSTIVSNDGFPELSIDILGNTEELTHIIEQAKPHFISYEKQSRFNEVPKVKLQNTKPDFSTVEKKYNITFSDKLKSLSFSGLRQELIKDSNYITNNINGRVPWELLIGISSKILEFDFVMAMFVSQSTHEKGWLSDLNRSMDFLFNPDKKLSKQISQLSYNKIYLDGLLSACAEEGDRSKLFDLLMSEPRIPYAEQKDVLIYLKSLPVHKMKELGFSLVEFLSLIPKTIYIDNFALLKQATNFVLNNPNELNLHEFYQLIGRVAIFKDKATVLFDKVFKYYNEHKDLSIIKFIANLNSKASNFDKIIAWLTNLQAVDIKQITNNPNVDLKQLFKIVDIEKIKIVADIILSLDHKLSKDQYDKIIKYITKHDLYEAKLIKSYLLAPGVAQDLKTALIIDNLNALEKGQVIFSENNLERYSYDSKRVNDKISKIICKTELADKSSIEAADARQYLLYESFVAVMTKSKSYKDFNYNQLRDKSHTLKHQHMLQKGASEAHLRSIDLEFIALSIEVMYREIGKFPRDTQILSVLNAIINEQHLIEEIATGQGKSMITALHAAYLWFIGQTADVTSSARDLAARDLKQFAPFYDALGIMHGDAIITPQSLPIDYKKGGVNYAIPSDLALFRADREFHSNKHDVSLNTDVSIVSDEIDATLTSDVNFKLATPLINTNQQETRVLFSYILDFTESPVFKNSNVSRADDVRNLQLFLEYQFEKYDSSFHFPLNIVQLDKLKRSTDKTANALYNLNQALVKCESDRSELFDKLLDSVSIARNLEKGVHFVVLPCEKDQNKMLKAIPIVKDQPSKDTVFGEGVQAFLHLLLEQQKPEWFMKFEVSPPTATIFNISPKNFFDYYRLTDGRSVGLTGTAGSKIELQEFFAINKMTAFSIPKFEEDKKVFLSDLEVDNLELQYTATIEVLRNITSGRPVLIFCESTKHAEGVYNFITSKYRHVQLYASSPLDTNSLAVVLENAGTNNIITVTTPMLGRGTDFSTKHTDGYFAINLCTDITFNTLWQIYGRIARNGDRGTAVSIFNRELYATGVDTPMKHMEYVSSAEKHMRTCSQPLTDILKYFGNINHDNTFSAILTNEFISKAWKKLLEENDKASPQDKRQLSELQVALVEIIKEKHPEASKGLDIYLQSLDSNHLESLYVSNYSISYVVQSYSIYSMAYSGAVFSYINFNKYKSLVDHLSSTTPVIFVEKPQHGTEYATFYHNYIQANNVKMLTHVFTLSKQEFVLSLPFKFYFKSKTAIENSRFDEVTFTISHNGQIVAHLENNNSIEILSKNHDKNGISIELENKIKSYQNAESEFISFSEDEKEEVFSYLRQKKGVVYKFSLNGEGSIGPLMITEFKRTFKAYQTFANSAEVDKIGEVIDNFKGIQELDLTDLEHGKYQAIKISTKVTSEASHLESILTDGRFLFWINRGGGVDYHETGIKIFKIIKDIETVKSVLTSLKVEKSQTDTREAIYSLLRQDGDRTVPNFTLVKMDPQKIGNCGWVQIKAMLKAIGIVGHMDKALNDLPDVNSQGWQKILKSSNEIYKDFTTFDRMFRAESLLYSIDPNFDPQLLDAEGKREIDEIRTLIGSPVPQDLLEKVTIKLEGTAERYVNTIYEGIYRSTLSKLQLEVAFSSEMGRLLQKIASPEVAKNLLKSFQNAYIGDFTELNKIYNDIKNKAINDKDKQGMILKYIIEFAVSGVIEMEEIQDKLDLATTCVKEEGQFDEDCVILSFTNDHCSTAGEISDLSCAIN